MTTTTFEATIQKYLENRAKEDSLFAETYKKANKSIKECCKYIYSKARSKRQADGNGRSQLENIQDNAKPGRL